MDRVSRFSIALLTQLTLGTNAFVGQQVSRPSSHRGPTSFSTKLAVGGPTRVTLPKHVIIASSRRDEDTSERRSSFRGRIAALSKLMNEPANSKKLVAIDRANYLELGKYGFVFGLTMWRFSLGRAMLGEYDTMGNSAKMLSLISTIGAQFLTVGGLYATVLNSQLRWASGVWVTARDTKRKAAFRRLKSELTDPANPASVPSSPVPLSAHLRAYLSDDEYQREQDSKEVFNENVKATVTGAKIFRLLIALFFASFVQLTAVAYSNTLFSRKICAQRFDRDITSYTDWIASTSKQRGLLWWRKSEGQPLIVPLPTNPLLRHCVAPVIWRFFIIPRGVVRWLGHLYGRNEWLVYSHESVEAWSGLAMFSVCGFMLLCDFLGLADAFVKAKRVLNGKGEEGKEETGAAAAKAPAVVP
jgi:hypothetical protein